MLHGQCLAIRPQSHAAEHHSLPSRLGGLGIINPCLSSAFQFEASRRVTGPLVLLLLEQDPQFTIGTLNEQLALKLGIHRENRRRSEESATSLHPLLSIELQRARELACLKGASSWLTVLPLDDHAFSLHKGDFRDAVCLRYGWSLPHLPTECICGASFTVDHAFTCPHGGYPTLRHNEIRDITAQLMSEVCPNVATEPVLQPVTNECFFHRSADTGTDARLDVGNRGFGGFIISRLILMFVCLILLLLQIVNLLSLHVFDLMIVKNVEFMSNVCVIWSEALLPPLSSLPLAV